MKQTKYNMNENYEQLTEPRWPGVSRGHLCKWIRLSCNWGWLEDQLPLEGDLYVNYSGLTIPAYSWIHFVAALTDAFWFISKHFPYAVWLYYNFQSRILQYLWSIYYNQFWKTIDKIKGKVTSSKYQNELLIIGVAITDPLSIASELHKNFNNVGPCLANSVSPVSEKPLSRSSSRRGCLLDLMGSDDTIHRIPWFFLYT